MRLIALTELMSNTGYTVVCDNKTCVKGQYNPTNAASAHMRLASAAGITPMYGGSMKSNGDIGLRSESINNTHYGRCDLAGTSAGAYVASQIRSGNVQSVRQYKSSR